MAKRNRLSASSTDSWETDWTKCCLCPEDTTYPMKSSDEGYKMLGKNIPLFYEVNALPIPLDIRRLNDGEGIESTMKKKNAKYHNLFRKFNNTNLERAQKRHMSPIPSGSSSESAVDNIDHNPSSTTSKSSFHRTGISIFQHPMKENVGFRRDQIILPTSKPKSRKAPELPDAYMNMKPAYL
ncbi:unnamed protein product [Mytilus coruscus]|uniref:Uncharacterized protein n=1 Tax=Mytilus coruscus TaxID=42192 RepID=A0A6J8CA76_MYTCO|nr:unnamed protein product [Mytilus coruscus]